MFPLLSCLLCRVTFWVSFTARSLPLFFTSDFFCYNSHPFICLPSPSKNVVKSVLLYRIPKFVKDFTISPSLLSGRASPSVLMVLEGQLHRWCCSILFEIGLAPHRLFNLFHGDLGYLPDTLILRARNIWLLLYSVTLKAFWMPLLSSLTIVALTIWFLWLETNFFSFQLWIFDQISLDFFACGHHR